MQLKKYIENVAPEVDVTGGEYPVSDGKRFAATIVNIVQMGFIGFIIAGENLLLSLG